MGGSKAPKTYQPTHSAEADAAMTNNLNLAAAEGQGTAAIANPGYSQAYQNVMTNPYDASMLSGINQAAQTAGNVASADLAQGAMAGDQAMAGYGDAYNLRGLAGITSGYANNVMAQGAPMASDASSIRGGAGNLDALAAISAMYANPSTADAQALRSYAPALSQFGFDPLAANYNFGLQNAKDTQNVLNAESGVAGPMAAGATGDAMAAYTRQYNADKASRAMAAIQALGGLYGQAGALDANALAALAQSGNITGEAAGLRGQATDINAQIANLANLAAGVNTQAGSLYGQAGSAAGNAANLAATSSDLAHRGAETQATAAQLPYQAQLQVYQDQLAALNDLVAGRSTIQGGYSSAAQGYNQYLGTAQNATTVNQNAARINGQNSVLGGLGSLVGTLGSAAIEHWSDRRLKKNIRRIGQLPSGLPLYSFLYKNPHLGAGEQVGVMAQEAREWFPEAVHEHNGYLAVDYRMVA